MKEEIAESEGREFESISPKKETILMVLLQRL